MDLNSLSKSIELNQVNNEHGFGEEIEYNTLHTISPPAIIKSFVGIVSQNELLKNNVIADTLQFSSLDLIVPPKQGDKITYNGNIWYVMSWSENRPYDIKTTRNKTHVGSRTTRGTM